MASGVRSRRATSTPELDPSSLSNVERLIFAQAVHEFGTGSWQEISRLLSKHPLITQPKGVFTVQSCVALYKLLMEQAGLEWAEAETGPRLERHLRLARSFYVARVVELKQLIAAEEAKFKQLVTEIDEIRSGVWDSKIRGSLGPPEEPAVLDVAAPPSEAELVPETEPQLVPETEPQLVPETEPQLVPEPEPEPEAELVPEPEPESVPAEDDVVDDVEAVALEDVTLDAPVTIEEEAPESNDASDIVVDVPSTMEVDDKEEGSDNEAVNELIGHYESDKPIADAPEEPAASPERPPPEAREEEEMQVDEEPVKQEEEEAAEPSGDSPLVEASPAPDAEAEARASSSSALEPSPSARAEGKRKLSDTDSVTPESQREKKRLREESEPVDEEEGVPRTRRKERAGDKRFQNMIGMLHSQISQHRYGNIFHNPIKKSEAPDYHDIVKRPMDLKTIKSRVKDGLISNSLEFQRDIYLMFANAMMYNRPGSEIYNMAEEMMTSSEREITAFRQTEGFHRM